MQVTVSKITFASVKSVLVMMVVILILLKKTQSQHFKVLLFHFGIQPQERKIIFSKFNYFHKTNRLLKNRCPRQNGYAMICTSPNNNLIAASEYGLQPECHVYQMPSKQVIAQFAMQTTLRSSAMSFSRDGNFLLIIGGVPDFNISIYDIKAQAFVKTPPTKLPFKQSQLRSAAFNPRSSEEFCVLSDTKVYFYTLKHAFMQGEAAQREDEEEATFELKESFRYDINEFTASQVAVTDDQPVVFSSFKWDMWNRIHLCTNKTQVLQISSRDTPTLEQSHEVNAIPLTTLLTQKNLIVSTDDGLITWYRVEQPLENSDGTIENSMAIRILDQVDYEYDFFENRNKITSDSEEKSAYPAAYLKYSKTFAQIVLGTQNGILAKLAIAAEKQDEEEDEQNQDEKSKVKKVLDVPLQLLGRFHTAPISGIRELNDSTQFITISEDSTLGIWETTTQQLLSLVTIADRPVSLAVSDTGRCCFIGTESGAFLVYDVSNRSKPRLVKQMRFFEDFIPLDLIVCSLNGAVVIVGSSTSDKIFVTSQKASQDYTIFGFIQMAGIIHSISFLMKDNNYWVGAILSNNLLQVSKLPTERQENRIVPIPDDKTHTTFRKVDPGTSRIMTSSLTTRIFVTGDDKYLKQYDQWPTETYENVDWRKPAIQPNDEYISHSIGTSTVHFSLALKKMATGGKDGLVIVRDPQNVRSLKEFQTHSVVGGGVSVLCLSAKLPFFYVAGVDGSIFIISIDDSQYPTQQKLPPASDEMSQFQEVSPLAVQDMKLFTDVMQEEFQQANADKKEAFKRKIMEQLGGIQKKLKDLLHENDRVTEIEKLERDDFVVDVQKQDQFIQEGDNVCHDIRKEAERTNLRLELLRERVIDSTWNKMDIHSKAMKSIQNDNLVFNFSIRKRTAQEQKIMGVLVTQRKIELLEKIRKIEMKLKECLNMKDFSYMSEEYFMNRMAGKPDFMTDESIALAAAEFAAKDAEKKLRRNQEELKNQQTNSKGEEGKRKPYLKITKGRLGTKRRTKDDDGDNGLQNKNVMERDIKGMEEQHWKVCYQLRELEDIKRALEDPNPNIYELLYDAFELYTDQRKRTQIELIREVIFELKRDYNKEFDALKLQKDEMIYVIKEKTDAIVELQQNLKQNPDVYQNKEHPLEKPSHIFDVADDEIKVEKYLTAEDRARLEEEERKRLEREAKLKGDTVGQRGLKAMMNGELTFKKDKNLFEEGPEREAFMDKPEEEMTEDEKNKFKEFLVKEKEFKDKQRKAWDFQLKNIRNEIIDIEYKFEEKFLSLTKKRLFYEHRIYEQELYIIRLIIMMHEGRETRLSQNKYKDELEELHKAYDEKKLFLQNCIDQMTEFQKQIQNDPQEKNQIAALEKYCREEQLVKRDYVEFITKGKPQCRVQVTLEERVKLHSHIVELDPFSTIDKLAVSEVIKKMEQKEYYEYERDRPGPSIVKEQFDKIVEQRNLRLKMDKTKEANNKRLNNLKDFIKFYDADVNTLTEQLKIVTKKEKKTQVRIEKLKYNFELIVYLKQGQVEIPQLPVATDYKDAILILKNDIIKENTYIKYAGDKKVGLMKEILNQKNKLKQVQYENKRLQLQIQDFLERAKDVQLYRVTKQTQEIIQGKHVKKEEDDKKRLDNQITNLKDNAAKRMEAVKLMQSKLRKEIKEKNQENEQLEAKARQLKHNVEQRQQIEGLKSNTSSNADSDPRKKAKDVANQRKLLDVIKQQEEEIMFLKDELDRLRARTFPSFAHLQNKLEHPDNRI